MSIEAVLARGALVLIALAGAYLAALWFVLAVWTFRDIEARSRSVVTQIFSTLLVVLFFVPGVLLYMILRPKATLDEIYQRSLEEEYLLQDLEELPLCPGCQHYVEDDFVLCPHCHAQLREPCAHCARMVDLRWARCPYCGDARNAPTVEIRERVAEPAARWVAPGRLSRRDRVAAGDSVPVPSLSEPAGEPASLPATEPAAIATSAGERDAPAIESIEPTPFPIVGGPRAVLRPRLSPSVERDHPRSPDVEPAAPVALPRVRASIHRNGNGHASGNAGGNGTAKPLAAVSGRPTNGHHGTEDQDVPRGPRHDLERLETLARMATGEYRQAMDDANPEALPDVARGDRD